MQTSMLSGLILCGMVVAGVGCSSPDVSLGSVHDRAGAKAPSGNAASSNGTGSAANALSEEMASAAGTPSNDAGTGTSATGYAPSSAVTGDVRVGACDAVEELSSTDDAWWVAHWRSDAPSLPMSRCGPAQKPPTSPSVVAKWVAPRDGVYLARGWSADFNSVLVGSTRCGASGFDVPCALLPPQALPDPPWQISTGPGAGGFSLEAKAGDTWFFWFQFLDEQGGPPPDRGTAVANVSGT